LRFVPGTELHHRDVVSNAEGVVNNDVARAKSGAETEELGARAHNLLNSPDKNRDMAVDAGKGIWDPEGHRWRVEPTVGDEESTEIDPEVGKSLGLMPTKDGRYILPKGGASLLKPTPKKEPTNVAEKWLADNPHGTAQEFKDFMEKSPKAPEWSAEDAALLRAVGGDPEKPETQTLAVMKKFRDLKTERMMAPPPDHGQNFVEPGTNRLVRVEPGGSVPVGGVLPSQAGPTMQMRNVAAQASLVHEQAPHMLSEIDRLKDQLGPAMGRWNEFMQGHVGMDNPDVAGLRADLLMYSSAVALMHARGRLPENLREEFDRAINAPKQSPGNLKAVITRIDAWTAQNMKAMGQTPQQHQGGTPAGTIRARDPQGRLQEAPAGTPLPAGWKAEK
jgi:hypothetical protein